MSLNYKGFTWACQVVTRWDRGVYPLNSSAMFLGVE